MSTVSNGQTISMGESEGYFETMCQAATAWRNESEYIQVMVWGGAGSGGSSFGHVSVSVDGRTYSQAHTGYVRGTELTETYVKRQSFRNGIGYVLQLNPTQAAKVRASLVNFDGTHYELLSHNCTDPIETALESAGIHLGINVLPSQLGQSLIGTGLVVRTVPYPRTTPAAGLSAPWVK
jgi:hypothetical protein